MKFLKRTTVNRMLMAFALAEVRSEKSALGVAIRKAPPDHALAQKVRANADLGPADWDVLVRAILQTRAPLLESLVASPAVEWWEAETTVDELLGMRFIAVSEWLAKWPSQRLADLCGLRHVPGNAPEFQGWPDLITQPIAVGRDNDYCLVEGYTRCCTLIRDTRAGLCLPTPVRIIVGLWEHVDQWVSPMGTRWYGLDERQGSR